jgi:hypothetical protein
MTFGYPIISFKALIVEARYIGWEANCFVLPIFIGRREFLKANSFGGAVS